MLDVKRDYFTMRPHLGRLYFVVANPEPLMPALVTLGFAPLEQPVVVGDVAFHLAALDFGPESIDGWLANLAAAELGIPRSPLLDAGDRTVDVQGLRVQLSPLEFGVLEALHERRGSRSVASICSRSCGERSTTAAATSLTSSCAPSAASSARPPAESRRFAASATACAEQRNSGPLS